MVSRACVDYFPLAINCFNDQYGNEQNNSFAAAGRNLSSFASTSQRIQERVAELTAEGILAHGGSTQSLNRRPSWFVTRRSTS
jgi:hypothetical protein